MTSTPQIRFQRVWRRRWLVAGVSVLAVLIAAAVSLSKPTTYTSTATLMVVSQNRAPEQDSILTVGYVNFFNVPQYQEQLRQRAGIPAEITFEAQSVAASPLMYISATSPDPSELQAAAGRMAEAFQNEINDRMQAKRDAAIAAVRKPFDDIRQSGGVVPEQALIQMQDRISAINGDNSNDLQILRVDSTAVASSRNEAVLLPLALVGGLVVGVLLALALGALARRLESEGEVSARTGLRTLGSIPGDGDPDQVQSVQRLANLVALSVPHPAVVVLTSARPSDAVAALGRELGAQRATQVVRTLVVDAALPGEGGSDAAEGNPAAVIAGRRVVPFEDLLAPGGELDPERIRATLQGLREAVDLTIVVVPGLLEVVAGQAICAAADRTVIVVEPGVSRRDDVVAVARRVTEVNGQLLGAVVVSPGFSDGSPQRVTDVSAEPDPRSGADPEVTDQAVDDRSEPAASTTAPDPAVPTDVEGEPALEGAVVPQIPGPRVPSGPDSGAPGSDEPGPDEPDSTEQVSTGPGSPGAERPNGSTPKDVLATRNGTTPARAGGSRPALRPSPRPRGIDVTNGPATRTHP